MAKVLTSEEVTTRKMTLADIDAVMKIDAESFATTWPRDIFERELTENHFSTYLVMEMNEQVIGYVGMWMIIDEAQITNIAVLPSYRGKQLGSYLFEQAIRVALSSRMAKLSLEVRVSNIRAQHLYRKFGLVPGGIRKNYYTDNQEDAVVMWVDFK